MFGILENIQTCSALVLKLFKNLSIELRPLSGRSCVSCASGRGGRRSGGAARWHRICLQADTSGWLKSPVYSGPTVPAAGGPLP